MRQRTLICKPWSWQLAKYYLVTVYFVNSHFQCVQIFQFAPSSQQRVSWSGGMDITHHLLQHTLHQQEDVRNESSGLHISCNPSAAHGVIPVLLVRIRIVFSIHKHE